MFVRRQKGFDRNGLLACSGTILDIWTKANYADEAPWKSN